MFREIKSLLHGAATLCITMAAAPDDKVRLTITRVLPKDEAPAADSPLAALNEPIVVTGTADELDVDLPGYLTQHIGKVASMRTTFEQLEATLESERKAAEARIAEQKKRGQSATAKTLPASTKPEPVSEPALF